MNEDSELRKLTPASMTIYYVIEPDLVQEVNRLHELQVI